MAKVDDRRIDAYTGAMTLSQAMLNECFRGGESDIEAIGTFTKVITPTTYTLRFADRPKYVGDFFYEGRAVFPAVVRTIGELQAPSIQFSEMEVQLSNVDGYYNQYLAGGATFFSPIGGKLTIQVGLRDVGGSLITVFDGFVPEEDGWDTDRSIIRIRARDQSSSLNVPCPLPVINLTDFPSAPQDTLGKTIPFVLGDWSAGFNLTDNAATVSITDAGTSYDINVASPQNFYGGVVGYNVGGGFFVFSVGGAGAATFYPRTILGCYVKRGDQFIQCTFNATPDATAGYWSVEVTGLSKNGGGTITYVYQLGDVAVVSVKISTNASAYDTAFDNQIFLARQILYGLGGKVVGDLAASFATVEAKSTPAQSAMTAIKGRLWIGEDSKSKTVLQIFLERLEEVRCEGYFDASSKIAIRTLHPEDFPIPASAAARIDQTEVNEEMLNEKADALTFFNVARAEFAFTPVSGKTMLTTIRKKNQNSIDRAGKQVEKVIDLPSLYVATDADYQLVEFLRFYSAGLSYITVQTAFVHLLRDLGEFVAFNYKIGSIAYVDAPMMIRDISIDLLKGSPTFKLLNLTNFTYSTYNPSNSGRFLSGQAQAIVAA